MIPWSELKSKIKFGKKKGGASILFRLKKEAHDIKILIGTTILD